MNLPLISARNASQGMATQEITFDFDPPAGHCDDGAAACLVKAEGAGAMGNALARRDPLLPRGNSCGSLATQRLI